MQRNRAPFWVVDTVAMIGVFILCFVGKLAVDTAVVIILAILGFGGIARRHAPRSAGGDKSDDDDDAPPGASPSPATTLSKMLPTSGGIATFLVGIGSLLDPGVRLS